MPLLNLLAALLIFVGSAAGAYGVYTQNRLADSHQKLRSSRIKPLRRIAKIIVRENPNLLEGRRPSQLRWYWFAFAMVLLGSALQIVIAYHQI